MGKLKITGNAKKEFKADAMEITITIATDGETSAHALNKGKKETEKLLQLLVDIGIDLSSVTMKRDSISGPGRYNDDKLYRFEKNICESYVLFDNKNIEAAEKFIESITQFYLPPANDSNLYWRICASSDGFYLDKGRVKCPQNFEVEKLYNDSFIKEDEKIKKFIAEDDKSGLVILHGEKGTGKSSYIKHLVNKFPERKFVYVPSSFITLLGEPTFGSFLISLNNHVIVLEDCENAIKDRKTSSSASAVSLLLNMTDGILSDDLGIKFICTFNDDMKNIDSALLRKGRLVSKYEFKNLDAEKAQKLLEERGVTDKINRPLSLAEIFHYEDDCYEINRKAII